jgi:thymidylate synthase
MSIITFEGNTAAQLYEEGLYQFRVSGRKEASRNGPVMVLPDIALFTLNSPRHRVLDDAVRNANPFFHMMEFIWMMAGRRDVEWIAQFNKQYREYADDGHVMAAYGYRWRNIWDDQIKAVIDLLKENPNTRQAVILMWNPLKDLFETWKDKACNTQIMFRNNAGALDMLVTNRSNDFVWGALGANIVHMTMLHELVSHFSGIPLGKYTVVSNNLHMYTGMPHYDEISKALVVEDIYGHPHLAVPAPMFQEGETYEAFVNDCEEFCQDFEGPFATAWMYDVAQCAHQAWFAHKAGHEDAAVDEVSRIEATDWRIACENWLVRKGARK